MRALEQHRKPHWILAALAFGVLAAVALHAYQTFGHAASAPIQDLLDTTTAGVADMGRPHLRLLQGGRM